MRFLLTILLFVAGLKIGAMVMHAGLPRFAQLSAWAVTVGCVSFLAGIDGVGAVAMTLAEASFLVSWALLAKYKVGPFADSPDARQQFYSKPFTWRVFSPPARTSGEGGNS